MPVTCTLIPSKKRSAWEEHPQLAAPQLETWVTLVGTLGNKQQRYKKDFLILYPESLKSASRHCYIQRITQVSKALPLMCHLQAHMRSLGSIRDVASSREAGHVAVSNPNRVTAERELLSTFQSQRALTGPAWLLC